MKDPSNKGVIHRPFFLKGLCVAALMGAGATALFGCQSPPRPMEVRRNFEENYAVRQILLGYYAPEEVPGEVIARARAIMAESLPCSGFKLLEDGMADRSEPVRTYDSFTKVLRTYSETKSYYWQKYRCAEPLKPPPVDESKVEQKKAEPAVKRPAHKPLPE